MTRLSAQGRPFSHLFLFSLLPCYNLRNPVSYGNSLYLVDLCFLFARARSVTSSSHSTRDRRLIRFHLPPHFSLPWFFLLPSLLHFVRPPPVLSTQPPYPPSVSILTRSALTRSQLTVTNRLFRRILCPRLAPVIHPRLGFLSPSPAATPISDWGGFPRSDCQWQLRGCI